jgi:hypothetical protein
MRSFTGVIIGLGPLDVAILNDADALLRWQHGYIISDVWEVP